MPRTILWMGAIMIVVPLAGFAIQADGEVVAQTDAYVVRLVGHEDRDHSVLTNPTVRVYTFEVTAKADGQKIFIFLGGDYLPTYEKLDEIRIFDSRLVFVTYTGIYVFDLHNGKRLKFLRALGPASSPSGRYVAYREWQTRAMPEEMQGAIVSVLDLRTLERRTVLPATGDLRTSRRTNPDDEFELYFRNWEEDPRQRCFTSTLLWSTDDSRLFFFCNYYLAPQGRFRERRDLREFAFVVVSPITDLKAATPQRFDLPDELFLVPEADVTWDGGRRVQGTGWLDENVFEMRLVPRPGLRDRILIDVAKGEIRTEP